jgi:hypothetical protein
MTDQVQEPQPEQPATEPVILTIQMSLENVNSLIGLLGTLPFEQVAGFIGAIRSQALTQLQAQQKAE